MFTGNLIMRPVAYDALSAGISGRTFVMPIASTPPRASSRDVRPKPPRGARPVRPPAEARPGRCAACRRRGAGARLVRGDGGQCLPAQSLQITQVAHLYLPVPIAA